MVTFFFVFLDAEYRFIDSFECPIQVNANYTNMCHPLSNVSIIRIQKTRQPRGFLCRLHMLKVYIYGSAREK